MTYQGLKNLLEAFAFAIAAAILVSADVTAHELDFGQISIQHPWALPAEAGKSTRMYLLIRNEGHSTLVFTGVKTPVSPRSSIMSQSEPGVAQELGSLSVPAGESLNFATSHMWVALNGLRRNLQIGDHFPVALGSIDIHDSHDAVCVIHRSPTFSVGGLSMVARYELTDDQWDRIEELLPGKSGDPGRTGADNRGFVNGVLWVLRSGAHWHDLPERYGKWKSVHKRFSRWAATGVWERVFEALTADPDNDYLMLDSSLVRAHQQAATGKGGTGTRLWGVPEED